jgi:hypothetical protein
MRIADVPWTKLELDEFACRPTVSAMRDEVRGYAGRNVTVACTARASPSADVFWEVKDKPLSNRSFLPLSEKQEESFGGSNDSVDEDSVNSTASTNYPNNAREQSVNNPLVSIYSANALVHIFHSRI